MAIKAICHFDDDRSDNHLHDDHSSYDFNYHFDYAGSGRHFTDNQSTGSQRSGEAGSSCINKRGWPAPLVRAQHHQHHGYHHNDHDHD